MFHFLQRNIYLRKVYFQRSEMEKWMIVSCMFSLLLVLARTIITERISYLFLPWNLFLAYVPYFIAVKAEERVSWIERKWLFAVIFIVWILFVPNSFYIITDLFHLDLKDESIRWFDLVMLFSFAWNGLLLGILSVRKMEKIVLHCFQWKREEFFLFPVMLLNAWGVYIGRYMRFNSWDVITNPFSLVEDIGNMLIHPIQNLVPWTMVICFAIFMTIIYVSLKRMAAAIR